MARNRQVNRSTRTLIQTYTRGQQLRASLSGRLELLRESLIAFLLLAVVFGANVIYLLITKYPNDPKDALLGVVTFFSFNNVDPARNNLAGIVLLIFNLVFILLFAQSVFESARVFFRRIRPVERQHALTKILRGHIIVCGLGRVGVRVVSRLIIAGIPVIAIEQDATNPFVARVRQMDVPVIIGDAQSSQTLLSAGIERASSIIASIDGDLLNLEIILEARRLNPTIPVVLRAFNEFFDRGIDESFGVNTAFSASALAAPTFAAAVINRDISYVIPFGNQLLGIMDQTIAANHPLAKDIDGIEQRFAVRIINRVNAAKQVTYTAIAPLAALETFRVGLAANAVRPGLNPMPGRNTVIICGLGKIGFRVVTRLHQIRPDLHIVVVQLGSGRESNFTRIVEQLGDVEMIYGDGRDLDVLVRAGLEHALTVAAVTSNDELNVRIGLEVRRLYADIHIVLRVFSEDLAEELADIFGINTAYSTSNLASPTLASAAILREAEQGFIVNDSLFGVASFTVDAQHPLAGKDALTVRKTTTQTVLQIQRGDSSTLLPAATDTIVAGDKVTVVGQLATLRAQQRMFNQR